MLEIYYYFIENKIFIIYYRNKIANGGLEKRERFPVKLSGKSIRFH